MTVNIWIEPHERGEAIEAYKDWLSIDQIEEIENAAEGALIQLVHNEFGTTVNVHRGGLAYDPK